MRDMKAEKAYNMNIKLMFKYSIPSVLAFHICGLKMIVDIFGDTFGKEAMEPINKMVNEFEDKFKEIFKNETTKM